MKKEFQILLLPTERISDIVLHKGREFHLVNYYGRAWTDMGDKYGDLHVVCDEQVKDGDFYIWLNSNQICKADGMIMVINNHVKNGHIKKIVVSTDKSITPKSWIHDSFLTEYSKAINEDRNVNTVEIEMEQLCCQTGMPCGFPCNGEKLCKNSLYVKSKSDGSVLINLL